MLQRAGLTPLHLHAKEGLALINGTHLMEAIAMLALADAQVLIQTAEVACAMSIEALLGSHIPLDARIHQRRGQLRAVVVRQIFERTHRPNSFAVLPAIPHCVFGTS